VVILQLIHALNPDFCNRNFNSECKREFSTSYAFSNGFPVFPSTVFEKRDNALETVGLSLKVIENGDEKLIAVIFLLDEKEDRSSHFKFPVERFTVDGERTNVRSGYANAIGDIEGLNEFESDGIDRYETSLGDTVLNVTFLYEDGILDTLLVDAHGFEIESLELKSGTREYRQLGPATNGPMDQTCPGRGRGLLSAEFKA
jgi:hypothetical protein